MLVTRIRMQGLMSHQNTELHLPERGLVLITGPNGSGKSGIIETVSTAAFGKTLRGTSPWAGKGCAEILASGLDIKRTHTKGGGNRLSWCHENEGNPPDFESSTKAQAALESIIGDYQVWRRTSVFSSSDASHFTMATDGQRKKLIEQLLGLDRFDPALSACRADRKDAKAKLGEAQALLSQLESQLESGQQRKEEAQRVLATIPEPPDVSELKTKLTKIRGLYEAAKVDVRQAENRIREYDRAGATEVGNALALKRQLDNLALGNCDRCGQPITEELRAPLLTEYEQADRVAQDARAAANVEGEAVASDLEELREEIEDLRVKGQDIDRQIRASDGLVRQRQAAEQAYDGACKALEGLEERIEKGQGVVEEARARLALLEAVEEVLGLKGVRAHVLGRALSGIEQAANMWLHRIVGQGLCLTLKPYSEKKTGGISDAISLEIEGAGGGYGYKGASGGERRRIDVALLLALAEVAQAAHGMGASSLFIDEAMDSLDAEGVERVSMVLSEMSEERAVVVISHNSELQRALNPTLWLCVDHGKVERVR